MVYARRFYEFMDNTVFHNKVNNNKIDEEEEEEEEKERNSSQDSMSV